ncbi:MAG: hypothetical protein RLZZ210_127 [Pseudomonadota bacterium]|jgi:hypothetical protein
MTIQKILKSSVIILSSLVFGVISIAQAQQAPEINVQEINSKSATPAYTNNTNANSNASKVLFNYQDGKTQITETKDYSHSQRDIKVNGAIGSYNLSKPLNGAITDEKAQRNPSIQLIKF